MKTKETFRGPHLSRVKKALDEAVSICWDGCHKIYICKDLESHSQQKEFGYDMVTVDENSTDLLFEWFNDSCFLRFINAISECNCFETIIAQGDYDNEVE